jgi:two-component system, LytTR family, response regulator
MYCVQTQQLSHRFPGQAPVLNNIHKIMTLKTFTEFEREIPSHIICRVHKSYMVSIEKIQSVEKDKVKIEQFVIPVSDTYRKAFFEWFNIQRK